jgi:hypothetical protein
VLACCSRQLAFAELVAPGPPLMSGLLKSMSVLCWLTADEESSCSKCISWLSSAQDSSLLLAVEFFWGTLPSLQGHGSGVRSLAHALEVLLLPEAVPAKPILACPAHPLWFGGRHGVSDACRFLTQAPLAQPGHTVDYRLTVLVDNHGAMPWQSSPTALSRAHGRCCSGSRVDSGGVSVVVNSPLLTNNRALSRIVHLTCEPYEQGRCS